MHASLAHAHELTRQLNSKTQSLLQILLWLKTRCVLVLQIQLKFKVGTLQR